MCLSGQNKAAQIIIGAMQAAASAENSHLAARPDNDHSTLTPQPALSFAHTDTSNILRQSRHCLDGMQTVMHPVFQMQGFTACSAASQPVEQLDDDDDATLCAVLPDLVLACPYLCPAHVWLWEKAWLVRRLQL